MLEGSTCREGLGWASKLIPNHLLTQVLQVVITQLGSGLQARGVAFAAVFLAFLAKLRFYTLTEATRRTPTGPKASSRWRNVARVFKQLTLTLLTIAPLLELAVEAHATTPGPAFHVVARTLLVSGGWGVCSGCAVLEDRLHTGSDVSTFLFITAFLLVQLAETACSRIPIWHISPLTLSTLSSFVDSLTLGLSAGLLLGLGLTPTPYWEAQNHGRSTSPWDTCSPISRSVYLFTFGFVTQSHKKPLQPENVPEIPLADWPMPPFRKFMALWNKRCKRAKAVPGNRKPPSLLRVVLSVFGPELLMTLPLWFLGAVGEQSIPWVLNITLHSMEGEKPATSPQLLVLCTMFGSAYAFQSIMYKRCWIDLVSVISKMSFVMRNAVFQKMLRMAPEAHLEHSSGKVVNLVASDINSIAFNVPGIGWAVLDTISNLVLLPFFLYHLVGTSFLYAFLMWVVIMPVSGVLGMKILLATKHKMACADARIHKSSEVLDAMSTIKLLAWDNEMEKQLLKVRRNELGAWRRTILLSSLMSAITVSVPLLLGPLTLVIYSSQISGEPMALSTAFTALSFLASLQGCLNNIKNVYSSILSTQASFHRLTSFLACAEQKPVPLLSNLTDSATCVHINGATFGYYPSTQTDGNAAPPPDTPLTPNVVLQNVSLTLEYGELVALTGTVGVGKSTLLSALCGSSSVFTMEGSFAVASNISGSTRGVVGYAAQEPWLFSGTFRDNIVCGRTFDQARYKAVLEACELNPDLEALGSLGDSTLVGESGVMLSGGQRARVALARAVYNPSADIYCFDDVLAALDVHVGARVFEKCICSLLRGRTRVLVTRDERFLAAIPRVLEISNATVKEAPRKLVPLGDALPTDALIRGLQGNLSHSEAAPSAADVDGADDAGTDVQERSGDEHLGAEGSLLEPLLGHITPQEAWAEPTSVQEAEEGEESAIKTGLFHTTAAFQMEEKQEGHVSLGVYAYFFNHVSVILVTLIVVFAALTIGTDLVLRLWLTKWVATQEAAGSSQVQFAYYAAVYGGLALGNVVVDAGKDLYFRAVEYLIGKRVHERLLHSLLRAPQSFFDQHPSGIIINRLSADTGTVDTGTTFSVACFITDAFQIAFSLLFIGSTCLPTVAFLLPACVAYVACQQLFVTPLRDVDRLVSKARSPAVAFFKESFAGATFIRAAGLEEAFLRECSHRSLAAMRPLYMLFFVSESSAIMMDTIGVFVLMSVAYFTGTRVAAGRLAPGIAAICITFAQQMCGKMMWFVRQATSIELSMVAVERLREYTQLESEQWAGIPSNCPGATWPASGTISFEAVTVRYPGASGAALNALSFKVASGRQCGVVGRTGSGKSTLAKALFRVVVPSSGQVFLDGVDTARPPLTRLRQCMAMVPQDPVLFEGTVRDNLDLLGVFPDETIWSSLEQAHAERIVRSSHLGNLDAFIASRGDQLSVGEKQLLCIARAFLCKAVVLVFDEASSSVDADVGRLIHESLLQGAQHGDRTVIIIAHRLSSVSMSDEILVLDSGRCVEKGSPTDLLQNSDSLYARMLAANAL